MKNILLFILALIGLCLSRCSKSESQDRRSTTIKFKKIVYLNSFSAIECTLNQAFGFDRDTITLSIKPVGAQVINNVRVWVGFYLTSDKKFADMFDYFDQTITLGATDSVAFTKTGYMHQAIGETATSYFACDTNFFYENMYYGQALLKSTDGSKQKNLLGRFFINSEKQLSGELDSGTDASYLQGLFIDNVNVHGALLKTDKTVLTDVQLVGIAFPATPALYDGVATCALQTSFGGYDSLIVYLKKL